MIAYWNASQLSSVARDATVGHKSLHRSRFEERLASGVGDPKARITLGQAAALAKCTAHAASKVQQAA